LVGAITSLALAAVDTALSQGESAAQQNACSIVQVDVARVGGITPWLKTAHLAETFNIAVCPHFLMELHVALTCAVPNARWLEYIPQLESLTTRGIEIRDGYALPSHAPGLGIAWDFGAIERLSSERKHIVG
jgi:L-alanine-DL-glutamate epimerase-like enolase superfamily enzyme